MKNKIIKLLLIGTFLSGCSASTTEYENAKSESDSDLMETTEIKKSDDKYTYYVKDYKGMNVSQVGRWDEDLCADRYNIGTTYDYIPFIFYTENGEAVDENNKKDFYVVKQEPTPNTEEKITYEKKDDGSEYENLIETNTLEEIKLYVKPVEKK